MGEGRWKIKSGRAKARAGDGRSKTEDRRAMIHLFWFLHVMCGWMVDARMWGEKEKDAAFLKQYIDVYWLGWYAVLPFAAVWFNNNGADLFSLQSLFVAIGMSVIWDLGFTKNEYGDWVKDLPVWLSIPNPFSKKADPLLRRWVISFTKKQMYWLNGLRVLLLAITFFN